ncbi:glycerol-3-phosphate dehydrogenase, mitochondrial-like isoform X2 [Tubulanus polymorphus]
MVKEALAERANLIEIAPHLSYPLPIMLPVYKWWQIPYYWFGIKLYDLVAGKEVLKTSYYLSKSKALELFPMLKRDELVGAIVYYDGQHNDARMCLSIALTATRMGATVCNHTVCESITKKRLDNGEERVCGAKVKDRLTGKVYNVKAKAVINATGPYTDEIRLMDDSNADRICSPSSGVHVVLPEYYSPEKMGLLDPATSDGRVIFFLPWLNVTMAGTTDNPCGITDNPEPRESEIEFILNEIKNYLSPDIQVRRGDVLSAWSGIRPLVRDPNKQDTQSIARNHIIEISKSKLITIAGGKWTTYRHMAEETVDKAVTVCDLKPKSGCRTKGLLLDGAHEWSPTLFIRLVQDFGLESEVAEHLATTYGDKAFKIAKMCNLTGKRWPVTGRRIHEEYPYLEAEVVYAVREYACTAIDILARRTRLAFLNVHAAEESLPKIIDIMSKELNWDKARIKFETERARRFLTKEMGLELKALSQNVPINFTKDELNMYVKRFKMLDTDNKGYITVNDLRTYFKKVGENVTEDQLREILNEVDLNRNGQIDMGEFLQMMSAIRTGVLSTSRFGVVDKLIGEEINKKRITVDRSGGGV